MIWFMFFIACVMIVGLFAKAFSPGPKPKGLLSTLAVGIGGLYVGGFINFLLFRGELFGRSGLLMGIIGGVIVCSIYRCFETLQTKKARMKLGLNPNYDDE